MRTVPWLLLLCAGACAQAETTSQCVPAACSVSCTPLLGVCVDGRCVCRRPDGGDLDADAGPCVTAECDASCRSDGWTGGGACLGSTCQCAGVQHDGGDEADAIEGLKCAFSELDGVRPNSVCDRDGARALNQGCARSSLSDTCSAGMMCLNDGSGNRCRRLCRDDADCASLGSSSGCLIGMNIGGTTVDGIEACTMQCDVLAATGCDTTQACRPRFEEVSPGVFHGYTDCSALGTGTQGADCTSTGPAGCAARHQCFNLSTGGTQCLYLCEMSRFGSDCPAGATTCNDISDPTGRLGACL